MSRPVRRLHCVTAEERIDAGQATGLRMSPGAALQWGQALAGQPGRRRVHPNLGVDEYVRRVLDDTRTQSVQPDRTLDEAVAMRGGDLRLGIAFTTGMIPNQLEASAVELGDPTARHD